MVTNDDTVLITDVTRNGIAVSIQSGVDSSGNPLWLSALQDERSSHSFLGG
ncbi:hypothetical protein [Pseudomonas sp. PGPR40]|uniref:hypothetical protein n=1 Tax=Pseudomonas sp. PGPR40 TaxID=2913476 RepID=UPI001EDB1418|nr:hypothetical protein [Pseudomonas sp. PGPR40]